MSNLTSSSNSTSAWCGPTGATGYTGAPGAVARTFEQMLAREQERKNRIKELEMLFTGCSVRYDPFAKRMIVHTGKRIPWKDLESLQASGQDFRKAATGVENLLTESLFELLNGAKMMRELTKNNQPMPTGPGMAAF